MSHILVVGCGPAGISAALRLAERGQKVTLAAAKPPIYHRCAGLPGIDLPEETAQELRAMGAQSLSGHEIMHALSRRLLRFESDETIRFLPYHRLVQLAVGDGRCVGGVLLSEHAGTLEGVGADGVLLASGGMHTMFSENRFGCDGLAATLAFQAGAAIRNPDQINTSGRYPIFEGGLITSWDGETTVPGLYAAGECADGTALAFPFSQAMATGAAAADYLCESRPETDSLEAGCAVTAAVTAVQQLLDVFRKTRGTRAPAAVERRIRETVQRTMTGGRTARLLQRGLLDIRVMRQQAGRGGYDLGEGLYPAMRLPALLQLLEVMLTTAAFRLLRQDGDLTAVMKNGKIEVTAKRSAAVEAAAYTPEDMQLKFPEGIEPAGPPDAVQAHPKESLIGVGSALQSAAESEFAAQYNTARRPKKKAAKGEPSAAQPGAEAPARKVPPVVPAQSEPAGQAPALEALPPTDDTISFQPIRFRKTSETDAPAAPSVRVPAPAPVNVSEIAPLPKTAEEIASDRAVDIIAQELRMEFSPAPVKPRAVRAGKPAVRPPVKPQAESSAPPVRAGKPAVKPPVPPEPQAEPLAPPVRSAADSVGKALPSGTVVTAKEIVLEHDPVKEIRAAAESAAPPVEAPLPAVEAPSAKQEVPRLNAPPDGEPVTAKADAPDAAASAPLRPAASAPPRKRERVFSPDPEALLALAMARKETEPERAAEGVPVSAGSVFSPDPEDLLRISGKK